MARRQIVNEAAFRRHVGERNAAMLRAAATGIKAGAEEVQRVMQQSTAFRDETGELRAAIGRAKMTLQSKPLEVRGIFWIRARQKKGAQGRDTAGRFTRRAGADTGRKYASYVKADTEFDAEALGRFDRAFREGANRRLDSLTVEL